jgi:hypothetical protein
LGKKLNILVHSKLDFHSPFAEEMSFKKLHEGAQGTMTRTGLVLSFHSIAVAMSYEDLWDALRANKFVVEDTVEHLMAQMASQGL